MFTSLGVNHSSEKIYSCAVYEFIYILINYKHCLFCVLLQNTVKVKLQKAFYNRKPEEKPRKKKNQETE